MPVNHAAGQSDTASLIEVDPATLALVACVFVSGDGSSQVFDRQAERLEDRDLPGASAALIGGCQPRQQVADLRAYMVPADRPVGGGEKVVAGLREHRLRAVGEHTRARDRVRVELSCGRQAGADG